MLKNSLSNSNTSAKLQRFIITVGYWISTFTEGASRILIPLYFASIGVNVVKISVLFVFYELFGLAANLYSGWYINRFGYKSGLIISLCFHIVASLGYLFIYQGPLIFTILLVNALRSFRGVAKELMRITSASYFRHLADTHLQTHLLLGGKDLVKGIGLAFGGILLTYLGFKGSFLALGLASILALVLVVFWIQDYREPSLSTSEPFFQVRSAMIFLGCIRAFLYAGRDLWLILPIPIFLSDKGYSSIWIGGMLALGYIVYGLFQPISGMFVKSRFIFMGHTIKRKWLYEDVIAFTSLALMMVPLIVMEFKHNILVILACIIGYNILAGFATVPHNYLQIRMAQKHRASLDISCYKTLAQMGKVIAVFSSGILYAKFGLSGCLVASSVCLFVSAVLGVYLPDPPQKRMS